MAKALHFVAGIAADGKITTVYAGTEGADAEAAFEKAVDGGKFALIQAHHGSQPSRSRELADVSWPGFEVIHHPAAEAAAEKAAEKSPVQETPAADKPVTGAAAESPAAGRNRR